MKFKLLSDLHLEFYGARPFYRQEAVPVWEPEVTDEDAIEVTKQLGTDYGLLVGISSGANVWAARQLAKKYKGNIATVLPDRAERYFSTALL